MTQDNISPRGDTSPSCLAIEGDTTSFYPLAVDPQQATVVAHWRRAERNRLLSERAALPVAVRQEAAESIALHLDTLLAARFDTIEGLVISAWWPINAELNLRHWLESLLARGARVALPVVVATAAPLVFRLWTPECRMVQGVWKIPVPSDGPEVVPDVTLAPVVGWDRAGYQLGYGGGYFDRTLAALTPRPLTIGVGLCAARVTTIFPQPHDIAMDVIVTEAHGQKVI